MRFKHVIVIGASSGGIDALRTVAAELPADLPAPVCVVLHTAPHSPSVLPDILMRSGPLRAVNASNGEPLHAGRIYVAPPDCHLLLEPGKLRVTKGPRENRFRPAIDPLFRSAAQVYGPAAIGVVLTGNLDDGSAGLWTIKQLGGVAVVQDPKDALFPAMPSNALAHVKADHVVPLSGIAPILVRLTSVAVEEKGGLAVPDQLDIEVNIAKEENPVDAGITRVATPSSYACPECHGVLLQLTEGTRTRFRCHTGHAYSLESLLAAIDQGIDEALWNALRALEEGGLLLHRIAEHARRESHGTDADRLEERATAARRQSQAIRTFVQDRTLLQRGDDPPSANPVDVAAPPSS